MVFGCNVERGGMFFWKYVLNMEYLSCIWIFYGAQKDRTFKIWIKCVKWGWREIGVCVKFYPRKVCFIYKSRICKISVVYCWVKIFVFPKCCPAKIDLTAEGGPWKMDIAVKFGIGEKWEIIKYWVSKTRKYIKFCLHKIGNPFNFKPLEVGWLKLSFTKIELPDTFMRCIRKVCVIPEFCLGKICYTMEFCAVKISFCCKNWIWEIDAIFKDARREVDFVKK